MCSAELATAGDGRNEWRGGPTRAASSREQEASAKPLGQPHEEPLGATDVTEPIKVLVLRHLADELGAMGAQSSDDIVHVLDGEHDATDAQRVRRSVPRLGADRGRSLELHQLEPPVSVRGPHHGDVGLDAVEADDAVRPASLDARLALELE